MKVKINDTLEINGLRGKYGAYIKVERMVSEGRKRWLNLNFIAFGTLLDNVANITEAFRTCKPFQVITETPMATNFGVIEYLGKFYMNISCKTVNEKGTFVNNLNFKFEEWLEFIKNLAKFSVSLLHLLL